MMRSSLPLLGQRILVTGVSRSKGIGAAITNMCANAGADIAIHGYSKYDVDLRYPDANSNYAAEFVKDLSGRGLTVVLLEPSDLSNPNQPEKVVSNATKALGSLDGLILNHAFSIHAPIMEWTAEHIDRHFSVNVRASMLMIQAFAKQIKRDNGGVITLFTSGQYLGPMVNEIAYAASKDAIRGLCTQLASTLSEYNIRVNCVNPGPTDTGYLEGKDYQKVADMFPSKRWGTPEDAARLVQFLHSDQARWITGQKIASEGGFKR